uniref:PDZ domain-containing protein n=1 Tax=Peronospora matthiolae TaxID=2874970 RepID=A0AAV1UST1_9STRA
MARNHPSTTEATSITASDNEEENEVLLESPLPLQVELSLTSHTASPSTPISFTSSGRPKAVSAAAAPSIPPINSQDTDESNATTRDFWNAQRRTQSDGNMRDYGLSMRPSLQLDSAAALPALLAGPAHSESSLQIHNEKTDVALPPPISVRAPGALKPHGLIAMGEGFLAGMADFAGLKSPRDKALHKVVVVYRTPGPLYVDLLSRDDGTGALVKAFRRKADRSMADAEASGRVFPGDELVTINSVDVTKMVFSEIISAVQEATFPVKLTFHCHRTQNEELEKKQTILPPSSPSGSPGWGARLSQLTKSGSFEQKNSGSDLNRAIPRSPLPYSVNSELSGGKFGISLGKAGTDGVKQSFLRIISNKPSRPEEDKNVVKAWMDDLALKPHNSSAGGRRRKASAKMNVDVPHSTPIVAVTTGGRFVGVLDEDLNEFALTWFRKTPPETDVRPIRGVKRCPYFPSVDDVGAILLLRCASLRFVQLQRVVEMPRPLVLDEDVRKTVDVFLEAGAGSFSATLASNENESFRIKITAESVALVKRSEDDGGIVVEAVYGPYLQVLLDPTNQLRFTIKVQEFGGFLGAREGDICDVRNRREQLGTLSCFVLVAQNRQNRDILTLLIRTFRARVISLEQEELARADEKNLFMDPAFDVTPPPTSPFASQNVVLRLGAVSPASDTATTRDSTSSAGSPPSATTLLSETTSSPVAKSLRPVQLQREGSLSSMSSTRLSDLVGLERGDSGELTGKRTSDFTLSTPRPPRASVAASKNGLGMSSNDVGVDNSFLEGRLAAQAKEISTLREKLVSVSVLHNVAMQENKQVAAAIEMKNNRIELQQTKIRQLEKLARQHDAQAREMQILRSKLEAEERQLASCRDELEQLAGVAAKCSLRTLDQDTQTEAQFITGKGLVDTGVWSVPSWNRDALSGTVATVSTTDLQQHVEDQQAQIAQLEDRYVNAVAERNMLRAKSTELSREVRKLVEANDNRPLDDLVAKLAEQSRLQVELASIKAEAAETAQELAELKRQFDSAGDKVKGGKRLVARNKVLLRTVQQLKESLSEAMDQVDAVKKVNSTLASRLHRLQPDARGGIVDCAPTSPSTSFPAVSSDDEDGDDDEEDEDEELQDGIAAFRRSLTRR